jgi:DNA-binding protein HU-beta
MIVASAVVGRAAISNRAARMGRNPAGGHQIKTSKKVAFRAAKEVKEVV